MKYIADLHIHSKYSRATAKNLDLENLYISAQLKGITVLGTGDSTHPAWFSELKEKVESKKDEKVKKRVLLKADKAEKHAEICMDYASVAVVEAELACLEAAQARHKAEEINKTEQ